MKRRSFLALLGILPVAIKAAVTKSVEPKPVEQKPNLGHWMSDGTGCSSFPSTEALTWEKLDSLYTKMREDAQKQYVTHDLSHLFRP